MTTTRIGPPPKPAPRKARPEWSVRAAAAHREALAASERGDIRPRRALVSGSLLASSSAGPPPSRDEPLIVEGDSLRALGPRSFQHGGRAPVVRFAYEAADGTVFEVLGPVLAAALSDVQPVTEATIHLLERTEDEIREDGRGRLRPRLGGLADVWLRCRIHAASEVELAG